MTAPIRRSVRHKLLAVILSSTLTALIVAVSAMVAYELRVYHDSLLAEMTAQAELIGRTNAAALTFDDRRVAGENLASLRSTPKILAAGLYDARGRLFASFAKSGEVTFPPLPESDGIRVEERTVLVFKRITNDREILGTVYLRAQYELYERLLGYIGVATLVAGAALLVAVVLSRQLQSIITRPLTTITQMAAEVAEKRNFRLRADITSDDEIGVLAQSFNAMLSEIERATNELQASNADLGREIAERRRAEAEILRLNVELESRVKERTAQLEYANAELEAFCYSVSHDLRAPLRAIDGFSNALLQDFPEHIPGEASRYLARIRSSTQRMGQLIEDLLNLSKVSRSELQRRDVDLSELARQVITDLQARDAGRKVEATVWDGMQVNADPRLLRAALENLLGNAWKFTSKTEHPRIEVGMLKEGERSTIFVRDNGAGFDMAYAGKLFGAFQRLHSVNEYQGTGIGLATVQRIVHRHGGRIWAEAKIGNGAVFFFGLGNAPPQGEAANERSING